MSADAVVCPKCPGSNMLEMKTSDQVTLDFVGRVTAFGSMPMNWPNIWDCLAI